MIAVFLIPVYLFVIGLIVYEFLKWLKACHEHLALKRFRIPIIVIFVMLSLCLPLGAILPSCRFKYIVKYIGNLFFGIAVYCFSTIVILMLIKLILVKVFKLDKSRIKGRKHTIIRGSVCIFVSVVIAAVGITSSVFVHVKAYEINVNKSVGDLDELKIVLLADTHIGYENPEFLLEDTVEKINECNPDLVLIAGDIFDNDFDAIDDPMDVVNTLKKIDSTYGTFACWGNHDTSEEVLAGFTFNSSDKKESDLRMDVLLDKSGIMLLQDETVCIKDLFYIGGRADYNHPGRGIDVRKTPSEMTSDADKDKLYIMIDHEPRELMELAEAGVDIDLSGHTHGGQIFPLNLLMKLIYDNSYGLKEFNDMKSIVTSGVGLTIPCLRLGTRSEICSITVHLKK